MKVLLVASLAFVVSLVGGVAPRVDPPEALNSATIASISGPGELAAAAPAPRQLPEQLHTSPPAVALLRDIEALRLDPYDDPDYCTIGYGHLVDGNRSCTEIRRLHPEAIAPFEGGITREQAEELFMADLARVAESGVTTWVDVPLTQNEFDALVLLSFNGGHDTLEHSRALRNAINQGRGRDETTVLEEWDFGVSADFTAHTDHLGEGASACPNSRTPGLCARRVQEANLFLTGRYPASLGYPITPA